MLADLDSIANERLALWMDHLSEPSRLIFQDFLNTRELRFSNAEIKILLLPEFQIKLGNETVDFSSKKTLYSILRCLAEKKEMEVTELVGQIWLISEAVDGYDRLRVNIYRLNKIFKPYLKNRNLISFVDKKIVFSHTIPIYYLK